MTLAIIGIGYVGLPLVMEFAKRGRTVIAYDIDTKRIKELKAGYDRNATNGTFTPNHVHWTDKISEISAASDFIISVPTPVDSDLRPDFGPMKSACEVVGASISKGALVVIECTVHPGATEEIAGPILEHHSQLVRGKDFFLAYSPERINPGDSNHSLASIVKIVAGENNLALDRVAQLYEEVVPAGVYRASSIKVAEAAKIMENVQRDVNIALMNELSAIFERLGINTSDVIAAAKTKWNFNHYTPGLVGGHCIGVDPYYLIAKSESHGYFPELIRSSRRINSLMADRLKNKIVLLLGQAGRSVSGARVGILGCAFKENVSDVRNSQVPIIASGLLNLGAEVFVSDPMLKDDALKKDLDFDLIPITEIEKLDALLLATPHDYFLKLGSEGISEKLRPGGILIDVKSALKSQSLRSDIVYYAL